jgi:hypothetical protein
MAVTDWKRAFDLQPSQAFAFSVEQAMQMREKARAATRP